MRHARLALLAAASVAIVVAFAAMPERALARTATVVSIRATQNTSTVYRALTLKGRLTTRSGRSIRGATLRLESRPVGGTVWSLVGKARTSRRGWVARSVHPRYDTVYRFRYRGSDRYRPSTSLSRKILGYHYGLKFWEPFSGSSVNTTKWSTELEWGIHCNNHQEVYSPSALKVNDGLLTITASRRTPTETLPWPYWSGVISAHEASQYGFKYGYIETRTKIPRGVGLWPAVWLLPKNRDSHYEIDIVEIKGSRPRENWMTTHWDENRVSKIYAGPDFSQGYHTFGLD
jgi:hypothetical protein